MYFRDINSFEKSLPRKLSFREHQILILKHSNTFCQLRVRYRKYLSCYPHCFMQKKLGTSKDPFPTKS